MNILDFNKINLEKCANDLQEILGECWLDCYVLGDSDLIEQCIFDCSNAFYVNFENCPCQSGCLDGCPCENYYCEIEDKRDESAVLVLQHGNDNKKLKPFVIDFNGFIDSNTIFSFEDDSDINGACTVNYKGSSFIFGGLNQPTQVVL